jgi:hypothetical protein
MALEFCQGLDSVASTTHPLWVALILAAYYTLRYAIVELILFFVFPSVIADGGFVKFMIMAASPDEVLEERHQLRDEQHKQQADQTRQLLAASSEGAVAKIQAPQLDGRQTAVIQSLNEAHERNLKLKIWIRDQYEIIISCVLLAFLWQFLVAIVVFYLQCSSSSSSSIAIYFSSHVS